MTAAEHTQMHREAAEAPRAVRTQLAATRELVNQVAEELRVRRLKAVVTCARGSSDHAATFAKYLIETRVGVLTSSAAPSVSSIYAAGQDLRDVMFLAISQSGASPDLLSSAEAARSAGAFVVALVNTEDSPLAQVAHRTVPLCAAPETSVAATKSYIASLAAIVNVVASWTGDVRLRRELELAPRKLEEAWELDWRLLVGRLREARDLYVIGRGLGLSVAQEAALKLKETCGMHAEAFSAAEVKHGPMALVGKGFPVLMFAQNDATRAGVEALAEEFATRGADVILAGGRHALATHLPTVDADASIEPMLLALSFYRMAALLSVTRGLDPDKPPHLKKVTGTL